MAKSVKPYPLEDRTFCFARDVRIFIKGQIKSNINDEYIRQVIRSSSSIGANYIEANEGLSKKDTVYRIKICRKEAKETNYWLRLIEEVFEISSDKKLQALIQESFELVKIFSSIIEKIK